MMALGCVGLKKAACGGAENRCAVLSGADLESGGIGFARILGKPYVEALKIAALF